MTIKQTKQWLGRARRLDEEINALAEQKRRAYERLTSATIGSGGNAEEGGARFDRYASLSDRVDREINRLFAVQEEIIDAIGMVEDSVSRAILIRRYVNGQTWARIAAEESYSYKQITRRHGKALEEVRQVLERGEEVTRCIDTD